MCAFINCKLVGMDQLIKIPKVVGEFIVRHWFVLATAILYLFFSAYYMGPAFTRCSDSVYGFGDSTAGPIWRNSLEPEQPTFGGYTNQTNYPVGENLYSPVGFVSSVQTISMDLGAEVVGPICAYNLYNIFGYLTTSLLMFFFVRYLTRNRWVALLAGYAVAFTPYIQGKIGAHPSYGYASLLIAVLWLTIHLLLTRNWRYGFLLACALALCAYFDPYFTLLALTIVIPTGTAWLVWRLLIMKQQKIIEASSDLKYLIKPLLITIGTFTALVSPLLVIGLTEGSSIEASVTKIRGDVTAAAMLCSNKPLDYILPDPTNRPLLEIFGGEYVEKNIQLRNWCGYAESRVSLSLTLLFVIILSVIMVYSRKLGLIRAPVITNFGYQNKLLILILVFVALAAFLLSLPPYIDGSITPTGIILKLTTMWRIFAREYLVLNMAVVIAASLALAYISASLVSKGYRWVKVVGFLLVFTGVVLEYQINPPFSPTVFSYSRDVPQIYRDIRNNQEIEAVAEYPIDLMGVEYDSFVYYLTMQAVHGKKLLNSASMNNPREAIHIGLRDLSDPQTLPALRYLGIRYIIVHGEKPSTILSRLGDDVEIIGHNTPPRYALTMVRNDEDHDIVLLKLNEGPTLSSIVTIQKGYTINLPLAHSPLGVEYEVTQDAELELTPLKNSKSSENICLEIKLPAANQASQLVIYKNSDAVLTTGLSDAYQRIQFHAEKGDVFRLYNSHGYNMHINNLNAGCDSE